MGAKYPTVELSPEVEATIERLRLRIPPVWGQVLRCDRGWWPLLAELTETLENEFPDFEAYQVKEKFGGLRFYASHADGARFRKLVSDAESNASRTCELTGGPGRLMKDGYLYKTINPHLAEWANQTLGSDWRAV